MELFGGESVINGAYAVEFLPSHAIFFEASHWPCDHMISLRPLIGQHYYYFLPKIPLAAATAAGKGGGVVGRKKRVREKE